MAFESEFVAALLPKPIAIGKGLLEQRYLMDIAVREYVRIFLSA